MSMPQKCGQVHGKGMEGLQGVCGKCTGSVHGRCWKCLGSMWEVPGKCLVSAGEDVLEVVLSAESIANACKTSRKDVLRGQKRKATPRGFEPLRAEPNGFLVHHLNHSVTVSMPSIACHFCRGTSFWSSRASHVGRVCWHVLALAIQIFVRHPPASRCLLSGRLAAAVVGWLRDKVPSPAGQPSLPSMHSWEKTNFELGLGEPGKPCLNDELARYLSPSCACPPPIVGG